MRICPFVGVHVARRGGGECFAVAGGIIVIYLNEDGFRELPGGGGCKLVTVRLLRWLSETSLCRNEVGAFLTKYEPWARGTRVVRIKAREVCYWSAPLP